MTDLNPQALRRLRWYSRVQRFHVVALYLGITGVIGSFGIAFAGAETLGSYVFMMGWMFVVALVLESYLIVPFLKCPSCTKRFFMLAGWRGWFTKINAHHRACVNCGLKLDQPDEASGDAGNNP